MTKIHLCAYLILFLFFLLIVRLYNLQIKEHHFFLKKALRQQKRKIIVERPRGKIVDRNSKVLAESLKVYSLYSESRRIFDFKNTVEKLSSALNMDKKEILKRILKNRYFSWIKRDLSSEEVKIIKQLKLPGIHLKKEFRRFYPNKTLASHIIGFVGIEGKGLEGIEFSFDKYLKAKNGFKIYNSGLKGIEIPDGYVKYVPPSGGDRIKLTIDSNIQDIVEKELKKVVEKYHPIDAKAIVMNPYSGEILAMANWPFYDPNKYRESTPSQRRNRCITDVYEPGSTMKLVTASVGEEENLIRPGEIFICPGYIRIGKFKVGCHHHGKLDFPHVIAESCNVGTIEVAMRIGKKKLYQYLKKFGFGQKTGIELPGEVRGILRNYRRWADIDLASIAIGQGIAVTPLQMINAINVIVNGGSLMKPYIVYKIETPEGKVIEKKGPEVIRKVISRETTQKIKKFMRLVVEEGTGKRVELDYYGVAVKTGTAQKPDKFGKYSKKKYVASMVGFAPFYTKPKFTLLVVVNEPKGSIYGGVVAAEPFRAIVSKILRYFKEYPDKAPSTEVEDLVDYSFVTVPDLKGFDKESAVLECGRLGIKYRFYGEGNVVNYQYPPAGYRIKRNYNYLHLFLSKEGFVETDDKDKVPFLLGKTEREARDILKKRNINFIIKEGTGYVIEQSIAPGTKIKEGMTLELKLGDLL